MNIDEFEIKLDRYGFAPHSKHFVTDRGNRILISWLWVGNKYETVIISYFLNKWNDTITQQFSDTLNIVSFQDRNDIKTPGYIKNLSYEDCLYEIFKLGYGNHNVKKDFRDCIINQILS